MCECWFCLCASENATESRECHGPQKNRDKRRTPKRVTLRRHRESLGFVEADPFLKVCFGLFQLRIWPFIADKEGRYGLAWAPLPGPPRPPPCPLNMKGSLGAPVKMKCFRGLQCMPEPPILAPRPTCPKTPLPSPPSPPPCKLDPPKRGPFPPLSLTTRAN